MTELESTLITERDCHVELTVRGTVQGVGFRPFVFHLAQRYSLKGWVCNGGNGVTIRLCGRNNHIEHFISALRSESPPGARIDEIGIQTLALKQYGRFEIMQSERSPSAFTQVSPDLALCDNCRREMSDFENRRFGYPFTNCTHCGPRFTIIRAVPYDRPQTTMSKFEMCAACAGEYADSFDRRFHAQPIACVECGPSLQFLRSTADGWQLLAGDSQAIDAAVSELRSARVVMIKGIGGFHLACDARDESAVSRLRERKGRQRKPFAVMFPDESSLRLWCRVSLSELSEMRSSRAPITLLRTREECSAATSVAPGNSMMGALLPYAPLHVLLMEQFGAPLVMTSANRSEEPIQYRNDEALEAMRGLADAALVHDRDIQMFADDSIVRNVNGKTRVLRRSRGYVPTSIHTERRFRKTVLAFGADLKNTFCLAKGDSAIISQHLGDLQSECAIESHTRALQHVLSLYNADVELVACDLHPDYISTRIAEAFAAEKRIPLIRVQHHHAHLAACLSEHQHAGPALGVCLDGTGYGTDGTVWGGELLYGDFRSFERVGHVQPVPLLGNDLAAEEPWRMAVSWLDAAFEKHLFLIDIPLIAEILDMIGEESLSALLKAGRTRGFFAQTSAAGRLFDAVAALLFFGTRKQYEGEAAMQLEQMVSTHAKPAYNFELVECSGRWVISPVPMICQLVADIQAGVAASVIARRFHEGFVAAWIELTCRAAAKFECRTVAMTGGCFQNAFLLNKMERELRKRGFEVLAHCDVPCNDGGIALGQAFIANAQLGEE